LLEPQFWTTRIGRRIEKFTSSILRLSGFVGIDLNLFNLLSRSIENVFLNRNLTVSWAKEAAIAANEIND